VLGFGNRAGVTYLSGEISRAYGPKVTSYRRSFVFVEYPEGNCPAALFVYDDIVSANPDFKKYWLCHGVNPPEIQGSRSIFSVTERGYNGRLTVDTLLPRQDNLEIIPHRDPEDFDVFGTKYPAALFEGRRNLGGACRIMVTPRRSQAQDCFLHTLQVSDGDAPVMEQPHLLEGKGFRGAMLRSVAVLFLEEAVKDVELTLPEECERVVLCGLHGRWDWNGKAYRIPDSENYLLLHNCHQLRGKYLEE